MQAKTAARRLRREIVVVLLLKLILLTALWFVLELGFGTSRPTAAPRVQQAD